MCRKWCIADFFFFFRVKCKTSTFKECLFQNSVKVAQIRSGHLPFILVTALVRHFNGSHKERKICFYMIIKPLVRFRAFKEQKAGNETHTHTQTHWLWTHTCTNRDWRDFGSCSTQKLTEQPLTKTGCRLDDAKRWNQCFSHSFINQATVSFPEAS